MSEWCHGVDSNADEGKGGGSVSSSSCEMQENDRGEEEANDGEVSISQKWVAVEDCDEDADVGAKEGDQNPSLKSLKLYCKDCPAMSAEKYKVKIELGNHLQTEPSHERCPS